MAHRVRVRRAFTLSLGVMALFCLIAVPGVVFASDQAGGSDGVSVDYVPPVRGAPKTRISGASRGPLEGQEINLLALVPPEVGFSARTQPTLTWYLSHPLPGDAIVEVTVSDEDTFETVLEHRIPGPFGAGYHSLDLRDTNVSLRPGSLYAWYVSLPIDPEQRSRDIVSGGTLKVVPIDPPDGGVDDRVIAFARQGYWYDALATLEDGLSSDDDPKRLRSLRAGLLAAVGLSVGSGDR